MKISTRENRLRLLNLLWWIPDKQMIKLQFKVSMKKRLDFTNLNTFNEKLQWLKLFDRKSEHTTMVDKYKVRDVVTNIIGPDYLIPLLGVWKRYEDIDFAQLPDEFVLKCNHDSGSVKIIRDKDSINHKEMKQFFNQRLKQNPYRYGREWPYKNVEACIVAEKYMGDKDGVLPTDYKFFCFNGYVDSVMICTGRGFSSKRFFFFDKDWNLKKYNKSSMDLPDDFQLDKPNGIDELFEFASKLSKGERFVRIDFYLINNHPYFGEFTYFPASGYDNNLLSWADEHLGSLIKLN